MKIPSSILKQLYTFGSLEKDAEGLRFGIKNRLSDATLLAIREIKINDVAVPLERLTLRTSNGRLLEASDVSPEQALPFPLRERLQLNVRDGELPVGKHRIELAFDTRPFGSLHLKVEDSIVETPSRRITVPRSEDDDYVAPMIEERQRFAEEFSGTRLEHLDKFSFDPEITRGNIENFVGVAQVPVGLAGPLQVNGEHASGEFLIPMATTEGTLVASYNRGMKVLNRSGGVTCTVVADHMQRAPVFVFDSTREARTFVQWVDEHVEGIREVAEATSRVARLSYIDHFLSNNFAFLRFNFKTGDAAGQNMVGRATFAACQWILEQFDTVRRFYLESNLATDKKSSLVNVIRTRGKRVIAEATVPRDVLREVMRVEPVDIFRHYQVGNIGAFLSGANNNGCHSPNAITAMFIATGQDVANVAESSAGIIYVDVTDSGDLYMSLTIPSLIVASYGGGTGLATQRECLEILGCVGKGRAKKLAEIVAGVALAGELSLASAISSQDWVSSHESHGRNR